MALTNGNVPVVDSSTIRDSNEFRECTVPNREFSIPGINIPTH